MFKMGVEIFYDKKIGGGYFFCNTSMTVFGEIMMSYEYGREVLEEFLQWFIDNFGDPRGNKYMIHQDKLYMTWLKTNHPIIYALF